MSIYGSAVKKPITTLMVFIAVIVFGGYSLINLPIDLYPEIELPAITVFTTYAGANAADIETNISKPLEDALNTIDKLKEIRSVSSDNLSIVTLEFEYETDLIEAANNIRDQLATVEDDLPEDANKPMIFKFSSNMMPIMMFAITAEESYDGIEKIIDQKIINPLNRVDGIGSITIMGAPSREVTVDIDPQKLDAYNISVEQIGQVLQSENLNMPSGNIKMGQMSYPVRVEGQFSESDQIKNIVVGSQMGQTIYLRDIATIRDTIKEITVDERINGKQGIRMMIMKQSGANTVEVASDINKELEKLKKNLPEDIKFNSIFDSSTFINNSIDNLTETLLYAFLFVSIVVLFFLGRWRATFIIVLTIPISLIMAFIYLYVSGNSINIISLSALSIAIGMVVDDAIVVLENISKHIDRGASPREAAIYATNEVWLAVIVTTLTVVAVFFPMTMVTGMTGVLFRQLGWIVTITVVTSTIAAITLTPMLSSKLLRLQKKQTKSSAQFDKIFLPMFDRLDNWYGRVLAWCLHKKLVVSIVALVIFIGSMLLVGKVGTDFMPQTDQGSISIALELQSGTRVEKTAELARKIDAFLDQIPEIKIISTSAGSDDKANIMAIFMSTGNHIINYQIRLSELSERSRSVWEISEEIRQELNEYPEIVNSSITTGNTMMGGGNTVDVAIFGHDLDKTTLLANQIADNLKTLKGARNVQISRDNSKPELRIELDREKLSQVGLNTATVSMALYNRITGLTATRYREGGNEYNIKIKFNEEFRNSISDLENISLRTLSGQTVKLKDVGQVKEYWSPPNIERKRRQRFVTVSVTPYNVALGDLAKDIQNNLDKMEIPQDLMVQVGGAYEDQQEGFADLGLLLLLSLVLVYLVMASQFESLKMPFIIMFSIPFAFSGVIVALWITNTSLSIIAALGAIMLVGIVVKNAIVLVDFINLMRDRGYELNEAIVLSGKSRLRPVLMTTLTTILGMLPLALSSSDGSEIWSPMGIAVIGGLVFSTVLTMVIVPVMYRIFAAKGERNKKLEINKKFTFMDEPTVQA